MQYLLACLLLCLAGAGMQSCKDDDDQLDGTLRLEAGTDAEADTLKIVSYNILEGMKLDSDNNYENFVKWVTSQNPDILALEEANGFTDASLLELARRWGHAYAAISLKSDDRFPVALTSKYPIQVVSKITKDVSHGCIHARVAGVNIVVLHLWPQAYTRPGSAEPDGNAYRLHEIRTYIDSTLHKYPEETEWLMMGDFNAPSPLDAQDLPTGMDFNYAVHQAILDSGYKDAVRFLNNKFMRSTPTLYNGWKGGTAKDKGRRIDFIYGSLPVVRNLIEARSVMDDFTDRHSDHYPITVTFRTYNTSNK